MEADRQVSGPFSMHPVKATEIINNMNYNNNNYEARRILKILCPFKSADHIIIRHCNYLLDFVVAEITQQLLE